MVLKGKTEGWAKLRAQILKKKLQWVEIELNTESKDDRNFKAIKWDRLIDVNKIIEEYHKGDMQKYLDDNTSGLECLREYITQRFEKNGLPEDAIGKNRFCWDWYTFNIYVEDQDYDKVRALFEDIAKELNSYVDTGLHIETFEVHHVSIPSNKQLPPELAKDEYGNTFEVGDIIARSRVGQIGTFSDVIVGKTEKTLICLSGSNVGPENCFVVKKGNGPTIYKY